MVETVEVDGHIITLHNFHRALIPWGQKHFRPFPWRLTTDPYHILIAEVMLHRTQAQQVLPVYERFVERYPDISTLSQAKKDNLHEILYALGLRWRIDSIYSTAEELMTRFNGKIPKEKKDLLSLSGVGDYIAGAVRCFSWDLPEALIDTNIVRIIGRLFGLEVKDSSRRNRFFQSLTWSLVDLEEPRAYNYAILDLADRMCVKKRPPECSSCPIQRFCVHGRNTINNNMAL